MSERNATSALKEMRLAVPVCQHQAPRLYSRVGYLASPPKRTTNYRYADAQYNISIRSFAIRHKKVGGYKHYVGLGPGAKLPIPAASPAPPR